jgi:hypothetical protein
MRRLLAAALLMVVTACAAPGSPKRAAADVDRDRTAVAQAIKSADVSGSSFHMTETLSLSGGSIPQGQQLQISAQADGVVLAGRAKLTYKILRQRSQPIQFDIVLNGSDIYIKPHGSSGWKRSDAAAATALYPALRLRLLREAVLLARDVSSGSVTTVNNGFAHKYKVTPASDQLEQLEAIPVAGQAEQAFLRSATAEVDAYLTLTGDKLTRIEVHLKGTDPSNNEQQKVDSTVDFTPSKVGAIEIPAGATLVPPSEILNLSG